MCVCVCVFFMCLVCGVCVFYVCGVCVCVCVLCAMCVCVCVCVCVRVLGSALNELSNKETNGV